MKTEKNVESNFVILQWHEWNDETPNEGEDILIKTERGDFYAGWISGEEFVTNETELLGVEFGYSDSIVSWSYIRE